MINKIGTPNKIRTVATSEDEFEKLKERIVTTNDLARCVRCGKLLAKVDGDFVSVKRKDIDLVAKVAELSLRCPICNTINNVCKE